MIEQQKLFSILEKTKYFDTKNDIRIYNIKEFKSEKISLAKQK